METPGTGENMTTLKKGAYLTESYTTGENYPRTLMEEQIKQRHALVNKADNYEIDRVSKILEKRDAAGLGRGPAPICLSVRGCSYRFFSYLTSK